MLFSNRTAAAARVLVPVPHPDDAELAAFGLYASRDSYVATVTPGNHVDGQYATIYEDPQPSLVADFVRLIETVGPDAIVAPHPALDANTDHQFTTIALLGALEAVEGVDTEHDLGPAPQPLVGGTSARAVRRLGGMVGDVLRDPFEAYGYFRRAARPNELFLVYGPRDREGLRRAFFEARASE